MQLQYVFLVLVLGIIGVLHVLEFIESFVNKIMYLNTKKKNNKNTQRNNKTKEEQVGVCFGFFLLNMLRYVIKTTGSVRRKRREKAARKLQGKGKPSFHHTSK